MSDPPLDEATVRRRLEQVHERIESARDRSARAAGSVQVLAVTKGFGIEVVRVAMSVGLVDLGENYAQELVAKSDAAAAEGLDVHWHMIGGLQRNKVRQLASRVSCWQSVDRPSLGDALASRVPGARVLVQCNLSGAPERPGCTLGEVPALVGHLAEAGLEVAGLMGVAPAGPPEQARHDFRALVDLADELGLAERSLGMSGDLEVAVEEGSTMVRLGTALFGPRPSRQVGRDNEARDEGDTTSTP